MLFQCWATVFDAGPTIVQHWVITVFTGLYPSGESMCRLSTVAARGAVSGLGAGWIRISSGGFSERQCIVSS